MPNEEWILIEKVEGQLQAEIIRGFLEAQGITVWVNPQGASHAYAVTVGTMGMVEILVPSSSAEHARQVLEAYHRGDFDDMQLNGVEPAEEP
jgi:hypothetical protein